MGSAGKGGELVVDDASMSPGGVLEVTEVPSCRIAVDLDLVKPGDADAARFTRS
jgi:hypothetical protein